MNSDQIIVVVGASLIVLIVIIAVIAWMKNEPKKRGRHQ